MLFANLTLAQKLEGAIEASHRAYVHIVKLLYPHTEACGINVAGGFAAFSGNVIFSQAIGVGLHGEVLTGELEKLQQFYWERNSNSAIELCPLAHPGVLHWLNEQQYSLSEYSNILYLSLDNGLAYPPFPNPVKIIPTEDISEWSEIVLAGFFEDKASRDIAESFFAYGQIQMSPVPAMIDDHWAGAPL